MDKLLRALCVAVWVAAFAACGFPRPLDVPECTGSPDCKSSEAPFCQVSSGRCVACLDGTSCPTDKPVCDASEYSCRGCARDDECPGGICVEADGTCVAEASVVYVDGAGVNFGTCPKNLPCNLAFGVSKASAVRNHIKILNGTLGVTAAVTLIPDLYIEGTDTIVTGPDGMFNIPQSVNITLSHMRLQPVSGLVTTVDVTRTLRLFDVQTSGGISVNGGTLDADLSTFIGDGGITCMAGTVTLQRSRFDRSPLTGITCQFIVRRTRFDMSGDVNKLSISNGVLTFENNLITQTEEIADTMAVNGVAPASTIRFNTFVNTAALPSDGVALSCGSPLRVSSNIFAYGSMHPTTLCVVHYSLYDSIAVPEQTAGVGNKVADSSSFFVDKAGKDFHLSPSSPARGAAEFDLGVSDDFDGAARPSPAGSQPDIGAFEAR
jgi:hypothetical protein